MIKEEGNRIIAKFMGYNLDYVPTERYVLVSPILDYDTSWDSLMPVVEKIKSMIGNPTTLSFAAFNGDINKSLMTADIQLVYKAAVKFIQWNNNQSL